MREEDPGVEVLGEGGGVLEGGGGEHIYRQKYAKLLSVFL